MSRLCASILLLVIALPLSGCDPAFAEKPEVLWSAKAEAIEQNVALNTEIKQQIASLPAPDFQSLPPLTPFEREIGRTVSLHKRKTTKSPDAITAMRDALAAEVKDLDAELAEIAPQTVKDPEWLKAVYPIRFAFGPDNQAGSVRFGGTAIAVGENKLHTVKHLTHEMPKGSVVEVQIDGAWKRGNWFPIADKDFAVVTVPNVTLKHVAVRLPIYGEKVTIYGLATKSFAQGTYFGDLNKKIGGGVVPLDPCEKTVENGDSGGGVFSDDGYLLGTITGCNQDSKQVVSMVPIVPGGPPPAPVSVASKAKPHPASGVICRNGQCFRTTESGMVYRLPSRR